MTFNLNQLQFIDSLQFLNSSLGKLSGNLSLEDPKVTKAHVKENFVHDNGMRLDLLRRK